MVRCWMEDSLLGVCHLHNGGTTVTLHRDLKPANLLVFSTGNPSRPYRVKLGDLGESKSLSTSQSFGSAKGTMFTMAPEVVGGRYRPASDMFSWGVTMCCAVVQSLRNVADPLEAYACDRDELVTAAVGAVERHHGLVASLLQRCYATEPSSRPSASEAYGVVLASRHGVPLSPVVTGQLYDVVAIVEAMESLSMDTTSVIDAIGGRSAATLDALRSAGVSVVSRVALKDALARSDGASAAITKV